MNMLFVKKLVTACLISLLMVFSVAAESARNYQAVFKTPTDAVYGLLEAIRTNNYYAISDILGSEYHRFIETPDRAAEAVRRKAFYHTVYRDGYKLVKQDNGSLVMEIGAQAWPFPIPIVWEGNGWRFDAKTGFEELLNRRVGMNELATIKTMQVLIDAQLQYATLDRDNDEVLEFAQKFNSTNGRYDGLFWKNGENESQSPLSSVVKDASEYLTATTRTNPIFKGYHYKILTAQGSNSNGGAYDYIVNGNMVAGFSVIAYPADYGSTGVMTFIANHEGEVFQKDLGNHTRAITMGMRVFNPDDSWDTVDN